MEFLNAWQGKRVLVTGGTGFIGTHVVLQGLMSNVEVHVVSRVRSVAPPAIYHSCDLTDRSSVFNLLDRIRPAALIHLAAEGIITSVPLLSDMLNVNVVGLENLLAASASLESKPQVVLAGSGFEYAPQPRPISETDPIGPFSLYGLTKAAASICAAMYASSMSITLLRLFSVYGPGEREPRLVPYLLSQTKAGLPVDLTGCEQVRDYAYVEDVAECFWRVLNHPESHSHQGIEVFNVGTGCSLSLRRFVDVITELLRARGLHPRVNFGAKPYRLGEPMTYVANVEKLRQHLNWFPSTSVQNGLRKTIEALL
jgi:UDP-glucose 4-epimerase